MIGSVLPTNSDPYLSPQPNGNKEPLPGFISVGVIPKKLPMLDKTRLFYHINRLTNIHHLCISLSVTPNILVIVHSKGHPGFSCCFEIITRFWFIHGLTKLFHIFIYHFFQYLALQTRQHVLYRSLQPIKLPSIPFFTLILNFVLALPPLKAKYNIIILVIYKFSKQVAFIKGTNTWSAEQWSHAFLNKLDLIDWDLPKKLITN